MHVFRGVARNLLRGGKTRESGDGSPPAGSTVDGRSSLATDLTSDEICRSMTAPIHDIRLFCVSADMYEAFLGP